VELDTFTAVEGTYTGTATIAASNAGTVQVPVSVTVDGTAPTLNLAPVREWWYAATGPVLSWVGQDNVTVSSNLLYSVFLEGSDTGWSGFSTDTQRDLTGLPDGTYTFRVVAKDQALNETATPATMVIHIDRTGNLWKQRIVDADLNDAITNITQVAWEDDFDGDSKSNYEEYIAGTDPTTAADHFVIAGVVKVTGGFRIQWHAKVGVRYQVLYAENPGGAWQEDLPNSQITAGSSETSLSYTDTTVGTATTRFYKIKLVAP
jgi:hypothetical protein